MKKTIICPHCGEEIEIDPAAEMGKMGGTISGKMKTKKQILARKDNAAKLNAAYTPEKRKAAAQKRLATLAAKKAAEGK